MQFTVPLTAENDSRFRGLMRGEVAPHPTAQEIPEAGPGRWLVVGVEQDVAGEGPGPVEGTLTITVVQAPTKG